MMSSEQFRAARALLRMEQSELARRAHVSPATIRRLEARDGLRLVSPKSVADIKHVLEEAGAEFIEDGVRCPPPEKQIEAQNDFAAAIEIIDSFAKLKVVNPNFTEADLYGDDGLPG
jgi:transcriptional regulator with XRE-family HTH domain